MVRERLKKIFIEHWEELEEITFSMIRMCLVDQVLLEVNMEAMTRGFWEKLEKIYMDKNMTNKLWLKK